MTTPNSAGFERLLDADKRLVDDALTRYFTGDAPYKTLLDAMRYSILAGGKRLRAVITLEFCTASGGDKLSALPAACAIEMVHAYSLIHDDLPCMDDDDLRRGKPSNHIVYGEYTAVLAGDALQSAAFEALADSALPADAAIKMTRELARAIGAYGMCGGQFMDMRAEKGVPDAAELFEINSLKTAALIQCAARLGVMAAGGSDEQLRAAGEYAAALGLAFQARDDILDLTATAEVLGKLPGSDEKSGKTTLAAILGIAECERLIARETERAVSAIEGKFSDCAFLVWLSRRLEERKY